MLSLRPIFDREGHMVFIISISVEVVDQFSRLKPLLAQVDRLNKLLPERIPLPAPPDVHERVSLVHGSMLLVNRAQMRERLAKATATAASRESAGVEKLVPTGVKRSQERVAAAKAKAKLEAAQAEASSPPALQRARSALRTRPSSSFAMPAILPSPSQRSATVQGIRSNEMPQIERRGSSASGLDDSWPSPATAGTQMLGLHRVDSGRRPTTASPRVASARRLPPSRPVLSTAEQTHGMSVRSPRTKPSAPPDARPTTASPRGPRAR